MSTNVIAIAVTAVPALPAIELKHNALPRCASDSIAATFACWSKQKMSCHGRVSETEEAVPQQGNGRSFSCHGHLNEDDEVQTPCVGNFEMFNILML